MSITSGVGCEGTAVVDTALTGDLLEPGVLALAQLAEAFLKLEHPGKGFGFRGVDGQ
jgi:hypothetical protein